MKTITKKIIGIMLIVMVGFFAWGVCNAEEPPLLGEAIPIAPIGAIDTVPTFEWTSVPGATTYCLLVEDIDSFPVYLAWYTDEEAGCTAAESEVCAVTPSHIAPGDAWSVLSCSEGYCGYWSDSAPYGMINKENKETGYVSTYTTQREDPRNNVFRANRKRHPQCVADCDKLFKSCKSGCPPPRNGTVMCDYGPCFAPPPGPRGQCVANCYNQHQKACIANCPWVPER